MLDTDQTGSKNKSRHGCSAGCSFRCSSGWEKLSSYDDDPLIHDWVFHLLHYSSPFESRSPERMILGEETSCLFSTYCFMTASLKNKMEKQNSCNENDACKINLPFDEISVTSVPLSGHQLFMQDIKHLGCNINTDFTAKHSSRGYLTPNKSSESRTSECKVTPDKTNSVKSLLCETWSILYYYIWNVHHTSGLHYHDHYLPVLQSVN